MSNTGETYNSDTVPVARAQDSAQHSVNPHQSRGRSSGPYAATTTHINDRVSNTQHGKGLSHAAETEKKSGGGPHNWGNMSDPAEEPASAAETKVPAEAILEPTSAADERRALKEANRDDPKLKTLDEYEAEGHTV